MMRWKTKATVIRDECMDILEKKKNLSKDKEWYENILEILQMDIIVPMINGRTVDIEWFKQQTIED